MNVGKRKSEVGIGEIATRENEKDEGKRAKQSKEEKQRCRLRKEERGNYNF